MKTLKINLPLNPSILSQLESGDKVLLTGTLYTARDQAHKRLCQLIDDKKNLPFDLTETAIFYAGPSPTPPGKICGAIGPTTSTRMDAYTLKLLNNGLRLMIGKGDRSPEIETAIHEHNALYLVTVGGAAAYLSQHITQCEVFYWDDLGPEAIYRLAVKDFPCYVKTL